ncbi:Mannose-6-phosphate isomerase, cupin superfamily [Pedobacter westerhofensis]|uniref:Mannose-6-phosphate isomerase, cupin superfamily n=1 Tax=Pedobacter westerhofensis TaxID=425512 RepID=A0A521BPU8_9SPHI|nr:cupin domain-containing protein [Pedobacter westerhofensis]SMO49192.1 Mannose-6-phosphate isomerase, cupin superfamily [Pedobacter westerhofensis]
MDTSKQPPITVDPKGGKILSVVGGNYRILVSGKQTNGAFSTIEMLVPPQNGPGPHSHADFYESFYIVDGEVEVHSEAGTYTAKKGSFVLVPEGGIVHYFKNVSDKVAQLLCTVVPAGLEEFFEEIGEPVAAGEFLPPPPMDPESVKSLGSIAQKHGQVLYPPNFLDHK